MAFYLAMVAQSQLSSLITQLAVLSSLVFSRACFAATRVESVPESGLQPEVAVARDGTVHLVYLHGEPKAAEVRYTYRKPGEAWHPSEMVNSPKSSAIALGTIRGLQLAVSGKGTVHVIWNGIGADASPRSPLWYARKSREDKTFGQPQDLLGDATALDGGASITANESKRVFVVWHGNKAGARAEEKQRLVLIRSSNDDGIGQREKQATQGPCPRGAGLPPTLSPMGILWSYGNSATESFLRV